jgi:hypothetical protein
MLGAGGVGFTRVDAETTNRLAEIDVMRKRAAIASRLATLRNAQTAA